LSNFCSPYVSNFILNVSSYDVIIRSLSDTTLGKKIDLLKADIGKLFPPRVLFPAIERCFATVITAEKQRSLSVVEMYRFSLKTISKSDANSNHSTDILNIMKTIFDVDSVIGGEDPLCDNLGAIVIEGMDDLILKLTENTLRPMYLKLLNWATESGGYSRRLLSFFRLSLKLSQSLKSLFLLFVGHILKNANDVLANINTANMDFQIDDVNSNQQIMRELVIAVLDTLHNCFVNDTQGFVNKQRFETLVPVLTNQMENMLHEYEGGDGYLSFAKQHVSPCLVSMTTCVQDSHLWKLLNHQLLVRTKHECSDVRFIALYTLEKLCTNMRESYAPLIPETIPFLAEILEDESHEVEKQCQKVIQVIEEISGESIQKYF